MNNPKAAPRILPTAQNPAAPSPYPTHNHRANPRRHDTLFFAKQRLGTLHKIFALKNGHILTFGSHYITDASDMQIILTYNPPSDDNRQEIEKIASEITDRLKGCRYNASLSRQCAGPTDNAMCNVTISVTWNPELFPTRLFSSLGLIIDQTMQKHCPNAIKDRRSARM